MGQNPTEDELLNLVLEVDVDGNGTIEFDEFISMMKKKASEIDEEADLKYLDISAAENFVNRCIILGKLLRFLTATRTGSSV